MRTQLSADSPLGPQVASPLRYRQPEREAGGETGRVMGGHGSETEAESDGKRSGQEGCSAEGMQTNALHGRRRD